MAWYIGFPNDITMSHHWPITWLLTASQSINETHLISSNASCDSRLWEPQSVKALCLEIKYVYGMSTMLFMLHKTGLYFFYTDCYADIQDIHWINCSWIYNAFHISKIGISTTSRIKIYILGYDTIFWINTILKDIFELHYTMKSG